MLKIFSFLLLLCGSAESLTCPQDLLATERVSIQKCEEYWNIMRKFVTFGSMPPCGWPSVSDCGPIGFQGMIVGGQEAAPMEFPHMAALAWLNDEGDPAYHCGGSLISERFVLTVAHCLSFDSKPPDFVLLGDLDLSVSNETASPLEVPVKRVIKHEGYVSINHVNDIALIELSKKVDFSKQFIRPACLQTDQFRGRKVAATGWGLLKNYGETSAKLMKIGLPMQKMEKCRDYLEDETLSDESQICAGGEKGKDTCQGDSGGPIQLPIDAKTKCVYRIIGLTSYGPPSCAYGSPAIYTKVSHYIDWIESHVWPEEYKEWKNRSVFE